LRRHLAVEAARDKNASIPRLVSIRRGLCDNVRIAERTLSEGICM
jgi:hypothetical protein